MELFILNLYKHDLIIMFNKSFFKRGHMNYLRNAKRLPVLDWNITFFGGHEQYVQEGWHVPTEKHYAFECIYILSGVEEVIFKKDSIKLSSGDLCIIPPEFHHRIQAKSNLEYLCFHFDIDDPKLKIQLIRGLNYHYPKDSDLCKKIKPHLKNLESMIASTSFSFNEKMTVQIELSKILQLFYQSTKIDIKNKNLDSSEYARIIAEYLKSELANQILTFSKTGIINKNSIVTVSSAIASVGFSDGYGFRIFKESYGISPREYLSRLKINEAKKLLNKPQYSINDIGISLGYQNLANFSKQFKRWTGLSPSKYKKSN